MGAKSLIFSLNRRLTSASRLAVSAAALSVVLAGSAAALECALPLERAALDARVLQSHAMVAALSCRQEPRYNAFAQKFRSELVDHGAALRAFFHRAYGTGARGHLDSFVTGLANRVSAKSLADQLAFCAAAARLFDDLDRIRPEQFTPFAAGQPFAGLHGVAVCTDRAQRASVN